MPEQISVPNFDSMNLRDLEKTYENLKSNFTLEKKDWDKAKSSKTKKNNSEETDILAQKVNTLTDLQNRIDELKEINQLPTKELNEKYNKLKFEFQKGMAKLNADSMTTAEENLTDFRSKLINMNEALKKLKKIIDDRPGAFIQMSKSTKFNYRGYNR